MKPLNVQFPQFLKGIARDPELSLIFLKELWPRVVGDELARKTAPLALRDRTLVVEVPGEVWRSQLAEVEGLFRERINAFWGCLLIERIQFKNRLSGRMKDEG